jgi:hypothetical protein
MGYRPTATASELAAFAAAGGCFQARTVAIFSGSTKVSVYMVVLRLPLQIKQFGDQVGQSRLVGREAVVWVVAVNEGRATVRSSKEKVAQVHVHVHKHEKPL